MNKNRVREIYFVFFLQEILMGGEVMHSMYVNLFELLLTFVEYAVHPPGVKPELRHVEPVIISNGPKRPTPQVCLI